MLAGRRRAAVRISLVTPAARGSRHGNRATAVRWASLLRDLGHRVVVEETWSGRDTELLLALHARRSHSSITCFAAAHLDRPLVVALTGTDLYRDIRSDVAARESLELATRLVVLQELGLDELEPALRRKARTIHQSAEPFRRLPPASRWFDVCVAGHLRPEKDPLRPALAAALLPERSRIRVTHMGDARDEALALEVRARAAASPRYRWLGDVPRWRVRRLMARSRLLLHPSTLEGGANVVTEALASGLPLVAADIPGNVGLLGSGYAGLYPPGNEAALAQLLARVESEPALYALLARQCAARRPLTLPERERAALGELVEEALRAHRPQAA